MASPQLEDGYTKVANKILEALARINLSPYESRVLWFIIRKTYGWHKKTDWIALSQIVTGTGIAKPNVCRTIRKLSSRNLIIRPDSKHVGFQKDYTKWLGKKLSLEIMSVIYLDTHKRNYTKQTNTKEIGLRHLWSSAFALNCQRDSEYGAYLLPLDGIEKLC